MPADPSSNILFAFNSQNTDATSNPANTLSKTIETQMATSEGRCFAATCSEFSQTYSGYLRISQRLRQTSSEPVKTPSIVKFLPEQDYTTALQQFKMAIEDAQGYLLAWEAGEAEELELRHALGLSRLKLLRAAELITDYHNNLSTLAKETAKKFAEQTLEIIAYLAGRVPPPEQQDVLNAHEERLKDIDYSDAPENYFCPISCHLMTNPMTVVIGKATHVYDQSVIIKAQEEHGENACCPMSTVLFKNLSIVPNKALKLEIEEWVESKLNKRADLKV